MKKLYFIFLLSIAIFSCSKQEVSLDKALIFSTDSLLFDTVFRSVGSATRIFKVYNTSNAPLTIEKVYLSRGSSSPFKININGQATYLAENIKIGAKDSIYIFAKVKISPGEGDIIETDSIIFETANKKNKVVLEAFGWDVHLVNGEILASQTWNNDKPYVIYNFAVVDTDEVLTIEQGTKVFMSKNAYLIVMGSLKTYGTKDSPVIFSSARLEQDYQNIPGQWGGIILHSTSKDNKLLYTNILNATTGLALNKVDKDTTYIGNCLIEHNSFAGVFAGSSNTFIYNSIISDCGWYALALIEGGQHRLYHNTIVNFYSWQIRSTPSLVLTDYKIINQTPSLIKPLKAHIANCIIWGSQKDEVNISFVSNYSEAIVENTLVKQETELKCDNCILNKDPLFVNTEEFDFHLQSESPAIDKALAEIIELYPALLGKDLDQTDRLNSSHQDLGAYQYMQEP